MDQRYLKTAGKTPSLGFSRLAPSVIARKPARDYASLQALTCLWSPSGRPRSLRFNLFTEVSRRSHLITLVVALVSSFGVLCGEGIADEEKSGGEKKKLPKSGLLAVSSISGAGTSVVGDVFGGEDIFSEDVPLIAGSVSRRGAGSWRFSVINNSRDRYSVNVDLVQKNENGAAVKFGSYSYTLRPGQSDGEEVAAGLGARRAELILRSYRNLSEREKEVRQEEQ